MGQGKYKLSALQLKLIAVAAMLMDHIAYRFVENQQVFYVMRFVGRLTAPIMCFFIAEGFFHTKNIKKYMLRMAFAALISHVPYIYFKYGEMPFGFAEGSFSIISETSVIFTLFMGLTALLVWNNIYYSNIMKCFLLFMICFAAEFGDWSSPAVLWILLFYIFREDRKKQMIGFSVIAALLCVLPVMAAADPATRWNVTSNFGMFLAIPLFRMYHGGLGWDQKRNPVIKWFFYIFYPVHLLVLGVL